VLPGKEPVGKLLGDGFVFNQVIQYCMEGKATSNWPNVVGHEAHNRERVRSGPRLVGSQCAVTLPKIMLEPLESSARVIPHPRKTLQVGFS